MTPAIVSTVGSMQGPGPKSQEDESICDQRKQCHMTTLGALAQESLGSALAWICTSG